jgi:hypothetical protein
MGEANSGGAPRNVLSYQGNGRRSDGVGNATLRKGGDWQEVQNRKDKNRARKEAGSSGSSAPSRTEVAGQIRNVNQPSPPRRSFALTSPLRNENRFTGLDEEMVNVQRHEEAVYISQTNYQDPRPPRAQNREEDMAWLAEVEHNVAEGARLASVTTKGEGTDSQRD